MECGYNAASIRERIYADVGGEVPQAGILVYTAAANSDGTLGGLVDLGKPENLGRLLKQALSRAGVCSSDPLSSANLTGHAMEKNMEAGILIRGGTIPEKLHKHLDALVTTKTLGRIRLVKQIAAL